MAVQLNGYGALVTIHRDLSGTVETVSGRFAFSHDGEVLSVQILEDPGHFPPSMILGGMRQMIEEAIELCGATC